MIDGVCECQGKGIESLTTTDLLMLLNTLKGKDPLAEGMRLAINTELRKRR